ncbi:MAG TPA: hypothetical protein VGM54_02420 [Chthoniobacter sp.]
MSNEWEEAEITRLFGPPEVREQKHRKYIEGLIERHSEKTVRGILKALSLLDEPYCCERLRRRDLDTQSLAEIIQPYRPFGLKVSILIEAGKDGKEVIIEIDEGWLDAGSGGKFLLERLDDGSFRVVATLEQWIH